MKKSLIFILLSKYLLAQINVGEIEVFNTNSTPIIENNIYNKEFLNNITNANKDISSILKYNPNVSFDVSNNSSFDGANIKPDNISINGSLFYQNNFTLDGISITNDIDPAGSNTALDDKGQFSTPSQGIFLNTNILDNIELLDSFIPARYGNFTGGIINSKTKNPSKDFSGYINFGFTSSKLTKTLYPDCDYSDKSCQARISTYENDLSNTSSKTWQKYNSNFALSGKFNEKLGILFNFSDLRSIKTKPSNTFNKNTYKIKNINQNLLLKLNYITNNDYILTPSIFYAPSFEQYNASDNKNGYYELNQNNLISKINLFYSNDIFELDSNISYSKLNYNRKSDTSIMKIWQSSNINNWSNSKIAKEGSTTKVNKEQNTLSLDFDFKYFFDNNTLNSGFVFDKTSIKHQIDPSAAIYARATKLTGDCLANDEACLKDNSFNNSGQFLSTLLKYDGTLHKIRQNYYAFYLEDEFNYNDFTFRFGARADYNDLYNNFNLAPRIKASYEFNDDSKIKLGYARYYGRMPYAYILNSMISSSNQTYTRKTAQDSWKLIADFKEAKMSNKKLKTPYDDEIAFLYHQKISNFNFDFKYVFRNSKEQIMTAKSKRLGIIEADGKEKTYYANIGKIKNHNFSLTLANANNIDIFGIKNDFALIANYTIHKKNIQDYTTDLFSLLDSSTMPDKNGRVYDKENIMWEGKVIKIENKPILNFSKPWTLRLATTHKYNNFTLVNFIHYEAGFDYENSYDYILNDTTKMKAYEVTHQKSSILYDLKFKYEQKIKKVDTYASIDITNVFNTKRPQGKYSVLQGRAFYFEIGANF
ncbi:TonB-dependent receptor plug domain-containing protein [Campylobacter canadensis]|uniref:TonB-dependent receptor n=1 Tax=Campylobacter canadensis TaxID=449520 RepID=A0ABS7WRH0_9BACT|nr:hypothetical protein [Campylobacter canadensis]MBZ7986689.1 hypothetical protein [Campylobacter canadensis]MBZ7994617.1 hypothetical protein [Campylobacter canadensis]MBZ7997725.1 hypothetical protein [Campylobacter canadensis]MBZ7999948.1 hypothetical protein [Campylobacter canadensis]MBZ8002581.1 hypothetical protein [Campylobacter canadensis]